MILARCPDCATTFRVTPEQLKARGGKVRCGQCLSVFNALDNLIDEDREAPAAPVEPAQPLAEPSPTPPPPPDDQMVVLPPQDEVAAEVAPEAAPETAPDIAASGAVAPLEPVADVASSPAELPDAPAGDPFLQVQDAPVAATADAGLGTIRDTREVPGYSKWAERAVATADDGGIVEPARSARWPALLFSLLLLLGLLAQAAYHYRSEIGARLPQARPWLQEACAALGCSIPLPRQTEAISIEGSELQADATRGGMLVLQASLRNRAAFAQAYPALELTLTDTQDHMVIRRVLAPPDYLSPGVDPAGAFAAGSDLAVRLWIDARDSGAAGYRLYVFYP